MCFDDLFRICDRLDRLDRLDRFWVDSWRVWASQLSMGIAGRRSTLVESTMMERRYGEMMDTGERYLS